MMSMDKCAVFLANAGKTIGSSYPRFCSFKFAIARRSVGRERIQELARCLGHSIHGPDERGLIDLGGPGKPAEFSNKLESGCPNLVLRRGWFEVMQRFDVSAHAKSSFGHSQIANRSSIETGRRLLPRMSISMALRQTQ